jgi:hypothetical protein
MARLITVENLREEFPFVIQGDVDDKQLTRSIISASKRLKSWIGAEVYAEVAAFNLEAEGADETDEYERKMILQNAEGHLAMHYASLGLNTNLGNEGMVKREQAEGDTVNEYFTPSEVANFSSQYLELAREIAEPYLISDGTPAAGFEFV